MLDHVYKKMDKGTREHAVVVWIVEPAGLTALTDTSVLFSYTAEMRVPHYTYMCVKRLF